MFELYYLLKYLIMENLEKELLEGNQVDLYFSTYSAPQSDRCPKGK